MSKKQDSIRSEQSRDKHPEKMASGGGAVRGQAKGNTADHQVPHTGKLANDHNKAGAQEATQTNQAQRTPESRHEREARAGTHNQVQASTGGKGGGRGSRGAG
ncbi:hypothetical protein ACPWT1_04335 [Ramlibacter sp. MMS24-I3-19]|uniref:hypothetical protein n=1 Tax=Ramlibacter sp. MMS24-I3-19 TaxID=3416606 RepID=UPI003D03687B